MANTISGRSWFRGVAASASVLAVMACADRAPTVPTVVNRSATKNSTAAGKRHLRKGVDAVKLSALLKSLPAQERSVIADAFSTGPAGVGRLHSDFPDVEASLEALYQGEMKYRSKHTHPSTDTWAKGLYVRLDDSQTDEIQLVRDPNGDDEVVLGKGSDNAESLARGLGYLARQRSINGLTVSSFVRVVPHRDQLAAAEQMPDSFREYLKKLLTKLDRKGKRLKITHLGRFDET